MITDSESIEARLRSFLKSQLPGLEGEIDDLAPTAQLHDVIGSLSLLDLVEFVEQTFSVEIKPFDFSPENFSSLHRVSSLIRRLQKP